MKKKEQKITNEMHTFLERHKLPKWLVLCNLILSNIKWTELIIMIYVWDYPIFYIQYGLLESMLLSEEVSSLPSLSWRCVHFRLIIWK